MEYAIHEIASAIQARFELREAPDAIITHVLLDSRKLLFPASSLFFALPGPRRTGASFVGDLYERGVRNFVVHDPLSTPVTGLPGCNVLVVADVLSALQSLAAYHRARFTIPVIGITGSNGKTIVKEWLHQLLAADEKIVRSPRSYNSQTGVPLSILQINDTHSMAIFEAGISKPGEMSRLEQMIRPTVGVFTNLGAAHSEGFTSNEDKLREKLALFPRCQALVYGCDDELVETGVHATIPRQKLELFSWGKKDGASLRIMSVEKGEQGSAIHASVPGSGEPMSVEIPFTDNASVQNATACWCVLRYLGIPHGTIRKRMLELRPLEMRLELKQGINNCSVINDSYSSDLDSLTMALEFLAQQQQHANRTVILSDILQSGKSGQELYEQVAAILRQKNIGRLIGIGPELYQYRELFGGIPNRVFFASQAEFLHQFYSIHFHDETILLKGARVFEFEQISHLLEAKAHQTVLEINLNAVTHNLNAYQQMLKPGTRVMAMVKAFSYGTGGYEIANLLQFHKVEYLAVAYADEGVDLRKAGITLPLMVLNADEATFDLLIQFNLEPELYSFGILHAFAAYLQRSGIDSYPVHIKLDTGMHRLGFEPAAVAALAAALQQNTQLKVQSVFSHLAASDSAEHDGFTRLQAKRFEEGCVLLERSLRYSFIKHIANTSSIHRHPDLQLDMVRLGIGLYGVDADPLIQARLKNVSTLKTTISQLKYLVPGESVGYSRSGTVAEDTVIATVRIGYADGYPRNLSNGQGSMWVNGRSCPVVGKVCMDMTMLNVTGVEVKEGDEVIVFGEAFPVNELAALASTIPYEILTGISQRVKRVYYEE